MSGAYQVDEMDLLVRDLVPWSKATAGDSWDFLTSELVATYPFEPLAAGIKAWKKSSADLRPQAVAAKDRAGYVAALKKLLASLADPHVHITVDGKITPTTPQPTHPHTWNHQVLRPLVAEKFFQQGSFFALRLKNGLGYVKIGSWLQQNQGRDFPMAELVAAFDKLKDTPGIIIDVRANMGGDENLAMRIAGRFLAKPIPYAKNRYRLGNEYGPWQTRTLRPSTTTPYTGKLIVLQGRYGMSSNEGFLMMMRAVPSATTVGMLSRGASSNPAPIPITGDIAVNSSRWQPALIDGTLIEHVGVPPQVAVTAGGEAYESDDPMIRKAFELLGK
jgi:hypothetical protein